MTKKFFPILLMAVLVSGLIFGGCAAPAPAPAPVAPPPGPEPTPIPSPPAPEKPEAPKEYVWKVGDLHAPKEATAQGMYKFAELVDERTGGQIKLQSFPVQQLGMWMDEIDNIGRGVQEMGFLPCSPRYKFFQAYFTPWKGIDTFDKIKEAYGHGGWMRAYVEEGFAKLGIKLLGTTLVDGFDVLSGNKGPIVYPEDIAKLKARVRAYTPASKVYFGKLGPTVAIDMAEMYTALQLGTVDVMADMCLADVYNQFLDVIKYATDLNNKEANCFIQINKELYDSLTPELQQVLDDTADEVCTWVTKTNQERLEGYWQEMEDMGIVVTRLTNEQRAPWAKVAHEPGGVYEELREVVGDEVIDFLLEHAR